MLQVVPLSFSTWALLTSGLFPDWGDAALCTVGRPEAALVSTQDVPGAAHPLLPGCDLH